MNHSETEMQVIVEIITDQSLSKTLQLKHR